MVNPGREAAARALIEVENGAFAQETLGRLLPGGPDRRLGWFLTMGVLRRRGEVDGALRAFLRTPLNQLDPEVRATLRLGAFEKLFSRTRDHAAVHQAVEVVRALGAGRAGGLVNAVLRKVVVAQDLSRAERLNHPAWLLARWTERYGEEATEAWCARNNEPPPLTVVARDPALVDHWRGEGLDIAPAVIDGEALSGTWQIGDFEGPVPSLSGYDGGGFWVQDAAAVAVADLCGDVQDRVVLDACAAPGGKTLRLASRGARVFAVDRSHTRLARIRANLERMALSVEQLQPHDWDQGPLPGGLVADVVLVDAPCSSLGTLRRHPEIRWRRQEVDLDAMVPSQLGILRAASAHVAPGGVLIYAVCSPEPEEGEAVVDAFLSQHPAFSPTGGLTTAPPTSGEDAHQAFRLTRTEQ